MKTFIVIAAALVATTTALAQAPAPDQSKFAERKAHMLEKMSARLEHMQKAKACIEAAEDQAAMKQCRKSMHDGKKMGHDKK